MFSLLKSEKKRLFVAPLFSLSLFENTLSDCCYLSLFFCLFVGKKADDFQLKTNQYHIAPNSTSNLLIKGVFDDKSQFIYQGLIKIEKSGQKSHAYQKNKNLILSEKVYVDSRPFLEILAKAKSNRPEMGNGADVFRRFVEPLGKSAKK